MPSIVHRRGSGPIPSEALRAPGFNGKRSFLAPLLAGTGFGLASWSGSPLFHFDWPRHGSSPWPPSHRFACNPPRFEATGCARQSSRRKGIISSNRRPRHSIRRKPLLHPQAPDATLDSESGASGVRPVGCPVNVAIAITALGQSALRHKLSSAPRARRGFRSIRVTHVRMSFRATALFAGVALRRLPPRSRGRARHGRRHDEAAREKARPFSGFASACIAATRGLK